MTYYLFAGETYYAKGGGHDFIESSDCLATLSNRAARLMGEVSFCDRKLYDWYHICDKDMNILERSNTQAHSY